MSFRISKIPYTKGGGKDGPYEKAFEIAFKKDVPKYNIEAGEQSLTYVLRMAKSDKIMLYPPLYSNVKDFYIVLSNEDEVLDLIEFTNLPEPPPPASPPPIDSGTDVILPY